MKVIVDHLSDIIITVAAVALLIGVILTFSGSLQEFYTSVLDKMEDSVVNDGGGSGEEPPVPKLQP